MRRVQYFPVKCQKKSQKFNLYETVLKELRANGIALESGDILVVSSKFAAMSEGRVVKLERVVPSNSAITLAHQYDLDGPMAQLVLEESERVLGGIPGFVLALSHGVLAPNAGIDRSNVPKGYAILYPKRPEVTARRLRERLFPHVSRPKGESKELGIILSDSRIIPTRLGTVGVALAVAGMKSIIDSRGKRDLFENELKVTIRAVADQIATAVQLLMGESSESTPIVLVRGLDFVFESRLSPAEKILTIAPEKCLIIQGLRNGWKAEAKLSKPRR
jgi:coenzyme F420-0:L-glutamate ligase / coenzyme F420-1:gamma-L-glutamate ligase